MRTTAVIAFFVAVVVFFAAAPKCLATDDNERPPIEYSRSTPDNCVSQLQARLETGELRLQHDDKVGYLDALLRRWTCRLSRRCSFFPRPACSDTGSRLAHRELFISTTTSMSVSVVRATFWK